MVDGSIIRKEVSVARWDEAMGTGEVVEKKGSLWTTTGIVKDGKLYCHIEEIISTMRGQVKGEEEEEEEHHRNPFVSTISSTKPYTSKLQFRKEVSVARWDEAMGTGEVVEKKGSLWTTTGIVRDGKLYCHIEEILFLAERGALILKGSDEKTLSLKDIYKIIASGAAGCSWESFEAFKHLKALGYIVGRHGTLWTRKSSKTCCSSNSLENISDCSRITNQEVEGEIYDGFKALEITEMKPTFDVYLPNSNFRKSSPGDPSFVLSVRRESPPSRVEVENLRRRCEGYNLKFCFVY